MSEVEEYINTLMEKVELLESTQQSIMSFLRAHHITDVARQKVKMYDELKAQINLDTSTKYNCSEMRVLTSCGMSSLFITLINSNQTLTLICYLNHSYSMYSENYELLGKC